MAGARVLCVGAGGLILSLIGALCSPVFLDLGASSTFKAVMARQVFLMWNPADALTSPSTSFCIELTQRVQGDLISGSGWVIVIPLATLISLYCVAHLGTESKA